MTNTPHLTPERIMAFAFGYAPPLMIEAAIRHGLFDALADHPQSDEDLAAATYTSLRGVKAVCNALIGFGLLQRQDDGRLSLTPESDAFLVSNKPGFRGGLFKHASSQLIPKWLQLADVVKSGIPSQQVNEHDSGALFFEKFVEDIYPMSAGPAQVLAAELGLANIKEQFSVLDIAAGSGVWGIELAKSSPMVHVTAVDWPEVLPVTQRISRQHGVSDRFTYVGGDLMTAPYGQGYQLATLGHILHSEGELRSKQLLKRVHDALAPGGMIAIAEFLVHQDRQGPINGLVFAVNMLVNTAHGDTWSFEEISSWLNESGFKDARLLPSPGPSPLILAVKH